MLNLLRQPDCVRMDVDGTNFKAVYTDGYWCADGASIAVKTAEALTITLKRSPKPLRRIFLRWNQPIAAGRFFGDHWERGYGDFEWRGISPRRVMPWFFLYNDGKYTAGAGVMTRPNALCWWQADEKGVTLSLDVRCGGEGVLPKDEIELCTVRPSKRRRAKMPLPLPAV